MRKLISLAALAVAGSASAQSSITIFGVADANLQMARQAGVSVTRVVGTGSNLSNRLGFRGTEDLGGGLSASFWLESSFQIDSGVGAPTGPSVDNQTAGPANPALMFDRRSTVSLSGATLGEIRMGRDYVPSFYNWSQYDPFGYVGAGAVATLVNGALSQVGLTQIGVRASNSISYFLPSSFGPFHGQVMYALGENASNAADGKSNDGNYAGIRGGYAKGPWQASLAYARLQLASGDVTIVNGGASYDYGVFKLNALLAADRKDAVVVGGANRSRTWMISGVGRSGSWEFPISFSQIRDNSSATTGNREASKFAVGTVYYLSKRTAFYATYADLKNRNGAALTGGGVAGVANATWSAVDLGVRTSF